MRFSTRNAFYLRASNYRVIPLFLYLDERHVDWMTDRVLQLVIAELQPKIQDLLLYGRHQKKHKVQVERGDGYQYCYFLRTTTRTEVVLLKQKTFSLRAPTPPPAAAAPQAVAAPPSRKRKATATPARPSRASRTRSRSVSARPTDVDDDDDDALRPVRDESAAVTVKAEPDAGSDDDDTEALERNIKDFKPDVDVTYKGFGTSSNQLVLIIEPYPPLPSSEYAPPSSRLSSRSTSIAHSRARTAGTGRYSSTSLSVAPEGGPSRAPAYTPNVRNARNASRSVSVTAAATPGPGARGREPSATPGYGAGAGRRGKTPLFIPRDTPFGDEEDEDEHEAYEAALREGRLRLPSVGVRDGGDDDDDVLMDIPESMMDIGQRLVRSSEIEEGVIRSRGGWEERTAGEESAVLGREEPGD